MQIKDRNFHTCGLIVLLLVLPGAYLLLTQDILWFIMVPLGMAIAQVIMLSGANRGETNADNTNISE